MGFYDLIKFLREQVPDGSCRVNMIDEIQKWKETNPGKQPVILMRSREVTKHLNRIGSNLRATSFGGRHQSIRRQLDSFYKPFIQAGAKIVFFSNVLPVSSVFTRVSMRKEMDYARHIDKLNAIDKTKQLPFVFYDRSQCKMQLGLDEKEIAIQYGEYRLCTSEKGMIAEMVAYAQHNKDSVLAILAYSYDFLLFDLGTVQYWACTDDDLSFLKIETTRLDQKAIYRYMELSRYQYHVMIAVLLTIYFGERKKTKFDVKNGVYKEELNWSSMPIVDIIYNISDFIRNNVPIYSVSTDFAALSRLIFETDTERAGEIIDINFQKYTIENINDTLTDEEPDEFGKYLMNTPCLYGIWNNNIVIVNMQYIDLRQWNEENAKTYTEMYASIYKRLMGIVLKHKNDPTIKRRFCLKPSHDTPTQVVEEEPIYPDFDIPDLVRILSDRNDDEELTRTKWMMLFWVLDLYVNDEIMKKIREAPDAIQPVIITVLFLLWECQITQMEADTLIISENDVINGKCNQNFTVYPAEVDGRTIRVAHLYIHMRVLLDKCFSICGIGLSKVPVQFDGVHFHNSKDKFSKNSQLFQQERDSIKSYAVNSFFPFNDSD